MLFSHYLSTKRRNNMKDCCIFSGHNLEVKEVTKVLSKTSYSENSSWLTQITSGMEEKITLGEGEGRAVPICAWAGTRRERAGKGCGGDMVGQMLITSPSPTHAQGPPDLEMNLPFIRVTMSQPHELLPKSGYCSERNWLVTDSFQRWEMSRK